MGSADTGAREPQPNAEALARRIKIALDLGLQAWRSTPSRSRFHEAFDALNALLAAGVGVPGSALLQRTQEMRARAEALLNLASAVPTQGPWRKKRESLDADHPDEPPRRWEIVAGYEKQRRNKGHFHPEDTTYTEDEFSVVGFGYDRDYSYAEGGIEDEATADYIAACDPGTVSNLARDVVALTEEVERLAGVGVPPPEESVSAPARERQDAREGSHVCLTEEDGWRPCPSSLCQAGDLLGTLYGLRDELVERRACLVGVRDDLNRILGASTQDGGLWIRAVVEARLGLVEQAIDNTDTAVRAAGLTDE